MVVGRRAALAEGVATAETIVLEAEVIVSATSDVAARSTVEKVVTIASEAVAVSGVAKIDDMSTLASPTGEEVTTGGIIVSSTAGVVSCVTVVTIVVKSATIGDVVPSTIEAEGTL